MGDVSADKGVTSELKRKSETQVFRQTEKTPAKVSRTEKALG